MLNITGDDEAVNSSCGCARDAHSSSLSLRLSRNGFSREFSTRSHGRLHRKTNFRSVCWEKLYWIVGNHPTRLKLLPSNFRGYQLISAMTFQSSEHVGNSIRVLNYSWTIERQPLRVSAFNMNSDKSFKFYSNRISTMHDVSWNRTYPASVELNFIIHCWEIHYCTNEWHEHEMLQFWSRSKLFRGSFFELSYEGNCNLAL